MEFNSIPFISFINSIHSFLSTFSCFCSHPLFSTFVTLYTLILIYAPTFFLRVVFSPVFNSTGVILLFLLKLGANERLGDDLSFRELKNIDSSKSERLEDESDDLELQILDHKDKHYEKSPNECDDDLTLHSCFGLESVSLEQTSLDFIDHNEIDIDFKDKVDLGSGSSQSDTWSEPNSGLNLESNQMNFELEHEPGMESNSQDDGFKWELLDANSMESSQVVEKGETRMSATRVDTTMKLLEWNMKAPLEIIYETYEGEEEEENKDSNENNMVSSDKFTSGCERYPSLSTYYLESETDSSSDDDFSTNKKWEEHESVFFKWEEDEREELIEISLDFHGKRSIEFCQDEEDNLIEIDISP